MWLIHQEKSAVTKQNCSLYHHIQLSTPDSCPAYLATWTCSSRWQMSLSSILTHEQGGWPNCKHVMKTSHLLRKCRSLCRLPIGWYSLLVMSLSSPPVLSQLLYAAHQPIIPYFVHSTLPHCS